MNAANDSSNHLKSNNRYISSNKQVPSPQGAWRCWIIIRQRDRADTYIFVDAPLVCFSIIPFSSAEVENHSCLHPYWGEGSVPVHSGSHHWVVLRVTVPFPKMCGSWGPYLEVFLAEWCFQRLSQSLEAKTDARYYCLFHGSDV